MALSDTLQAIREFDVSELNVDSIGTWPLAVKIVLWLLMLVLIVVGGYYLVIEDKVIALEQERQQETVLKQRFERTAHEAANLDDYRIQIKEIEEKFGVLLRQLPSDTEVPGLLDDISDTGVTNGLIFAHIELKKEAEREFYVELPIEIEVDGTYHDFGAFVSGVAALPRIVTLHDFNITTAKDKKSRGLTMDILAKTYRYRE
jgi:type IV pilus assembly protein PilO